MVAILLNSLVLHNITPLVWPLTLARCWAVKTITQLNHHRLKPVGLKEPIGGGLESAKAASPFWGNMDVTIVFLKILGGYVFHNNFIGYIA